jgi:hypothetical protein
MKPHSKGTAMSSATPKTEPQPSTQPQPIVTGGSLYFNAPTAIEWGVKRLGLFLLFLLLVAPLASATETRLESFTDKGASYSLNPGGEFPGGKTTTAWALEGYQSEGALKLDYDFSQGGLYGLWVYKGWLPPKQTGFWFHARGIKGDLILVRLLDATGQLHQYRFALKTTAWERFDLSFTNTSSKEGHWGGSNDDVVHLPLGSIQIGPSSDAKKEKGRLFIDELVATTDASASELTQSMIDYWAKSAKLVVSPSELGGIFSTKDTPSIKLYVGDVPSGVDEVLVHLGGTDAYEHGRDVLPKQVLLTRTE